MGSKKDFSSAKQYAFRLIKFRLRSEKEIRDKLKVREYGPEVVAKVVEFLKKVKLLDDGLFAKLWVSTRIKRSLGLKRLNYELKKKGIDKEIIEKALSEICGEYNEDEAIRAIISLKLKKMKGLEPAKQKSRLYGFLLRRGYPQNKIYGALQGVVKSRGEDE